jgi:hypothetical protein
MSNNELIEFLRWFRVKTEEAWRDIDVDPIEQYNTQGILGGHNWQRSTKWQSGLNDREIDAIEATWQISFPPDYRTFLSILNAPDRGQYGTQWSTERPGELERSHDRPTFYDWKRDIDAVRSALRWPLEGLLFDVENNNLWPDSWGKRPNSAAARQEQLEGLVGKAPRLIPIISHRYLLATPLKSGNPVLSVYQADIIVYGADLRAFLLEELEELSMSAAPARCDEVIAYDFESIPFWGELIAEGRRLNSEAIAASSIPAIVPPRN